MAIKVWIDAGHGGSDPGAVANGLVEKSMNLVIAIAMRDKLQAHGIIVGMTRTTDVDMALETRCAKANAWGANYFISIHNNAGGGDGAEAIHSVKNDRSRELALAILNAIQKRTGQNLRKAYARPWGNTDYFAVIRETNMPAVIVEGAFLDSADRYIVDTTAEQQQMGIAIAEGFLDFVGIPHTGTTPAPAPAPQPVAPAPTIGEYIIKDYPEVGGPGRFTCKVEKIYFRNRPIIESSNPITGYYSMNESVIYDRVVITNKYVYISWISASMGVRRYMPIREVKNGVYQELWGTITDI